jgi:hypothetical protein
MCGRLDDPQLRKGESQDPCRLRHCIRKARDPGTGVLSSSPTTTPCTLLTQTGTMSAIPVPTKGRHPLLAAYVAQLVLNPLRTKALTTGGLSFLQEVLASNLAGTPIQHPSKRAPVYEHALARTRINAKAFKMLLYGALVSAPLGHVLVGALQRAFAGKTSGKAKLAQILASNLIVAPIQTVGVCMSYNQWRIQVS